MPCTGLKYLVNPDAPEEGTDVHHDRPCPVHPRSSYAMQVTPATAWALARLRQAAPRYGPLSSTSGRAALLALATLADEGLNTPAGYSASTDAAVARLLNLAPSTTRSWLRTLVEAGLAVRTSPRTFRIPEEAFNQ